jgi:hypothetical protein
MRLLRWATGEKKRKAGMRWSTHPAAIKKNKLVAAAAAAAWRVKGRCS